MSYAPIQPYVKAGQVAIPGGEKRYLESELLKLQKTIQDLILVISQLQSKVTYP